MNKKRRLILLIAVISVFGCVLFACDGTADMYAVPIDREVKRIQMYCPSKNIDVALDGEDFAAVENEFKSIPKLSYDEEYTLDFYDYCFTITLSGSKKYREITYRIYISIFSASVVYSDNDDYVKSAKFVLYRDGYTSYVDADFMNLLEEICLKYATGE